MPKPAEATADHVRLKIQTLLQMAVVLTSLVIKVGRIAGSTPSPVPPDPGDLDAAELRGRGQLPPEFTPEAREPTRSASCPV